MTERERLVMILNEEYGYVKRQKAEVLADKLLDHGLGFVYSTQGLEFAQNQDLTYSVRGLGKCKNSEVIIPSSHCGKLVTHIAKNAFLNCQTVTSLYIPKTIQSIGEWAFRGGSLLTDITISEGVTIIDKYAFAYCIALESIVLPNSISNIEQAAFSDCSLLSCIHLGKNISFVGENAFNNCRSIKKIYYEGNISQWCNVCWHDTPLVKGADLYIQGDKVVDIVIPNTVTNIGHNSFKYCTSLKSVRIMEGVENIGGMAFYSCTALNVLELPSTIKEIGMFAFNHCQSLKTIDFRGTIEQWNNIHIRGKEYCENEFAIRCLDGTLNVKI